MKALVKKKCEKGLWLEEVPVPEIGINDVLIKIRKTSICGTDVHIYNWDDWSRKTIPVPLTIGHEFVGEIVELGDNVHDFKIGVSFPVVPQGQARIRVQISAAHSIENLDYAVERFSTVCRELNGSHG